MTEWHHLKSARHPVLFDIVMQGIIWVVNVNIKDSDKIKLSDASCYLILQDYFERSHPRVVTVKKNCDFVTSPWGGETSTGLYFVSRSQLQVKINRFINGELLLLMLELNPKIEEWLFKILCRSKVHTFSCCVWRSLRWNNHS